jgi:hypothetical protein
MVDHPELANKSEPLRQKDIYDLAWKNISSQPRLFWKGLKNNSEEFISSGAYGYEKLGHWSSITKICWWISWIPLYINRRNPRYLLIALSSLGTIFSAPLVIGDGGSRLFAASVAVDVLQIAMGFSWICVVITQGIKQSLLPTPISQTSELLEAPPHTITLDFVFAMILIALVIIPHTPLRQLASLNRVSTPECADEKHPVVTKIGTGGTLLLEIVPDDQKANLIKGQIRHADLVNGIPADAWWRDDAMSFTGKTLLLAYRISHSGLHMASQYVVYSDQSLAEFYGHTVHLCLDPPDQKKMFGSPYRKLNSITMLE